MNRGTNSKRSWILWSNARYVLAFALAAAILDGCVGFSFGAYSTAYDGHDGVAPDFGEGMELDDPYGFDNGEWGPGYFFGLPPLGYYGSGWIVGQGAFASPRRMYPRHRPGHWSRTMPAIPTTAPNTGMRRTPQP